MSAAVTPFRPSSTPSAGPSARVGRDQHPRQAGQRAGEGEREQDHALGRDAQQRGGARVLAHGPHDRSRAGHGERALHRDARRQPDREHDQRATLDEHAVPEPQGAGRAERVGDGVRLLGEGQAGELADQQRGGERARGPADHVAGTPTRARARNGRIAAT